MKLDPEARVDFFISAFWPTKVDNQQNVLINGINLDIITKFIVNDINIQFIRTGSSIEIGPINDEIVKPDSIFFIIGISDNSSWWPIGPFQKIERKQEFNIDLSAEAHIT